MPATLAANWRKHFKIFRKDGWPLCPCCGEDELWSPFIPAVPEYKGTLEEYLAAGLSCYNCSWHIDSTVLCGTESPHSKRIQELLDSLPKGRECAQCGMNMYHSRLKGYQCPRCD